MGLFSKRRRVRKPPKYTKEQLDFYHARGFPEEDANHPVITENNSVDVSDALLANVPAPRTEASWETGSSSLLERDDHHSTPTAPYRQLDTTVEWGPTPQPLFNNNSQSVPTALTTPTETPLQQAMNEIVRAARQTLDRAAREHSDGDSMLSEHPSFREMTPERETELAQPSIANQLRQQAETQPLKQLNYGSSPYGNTPSLPGHPEPHPDTRAPTAPPIRSPPPEYTAVDFGVHTSTRRSPDTPSLPITPWLTPLSTPLSRFIRPDHQKRDSTAIQDGDMFPVAGISYIMPARPPSYRNVASPDASSCPTRVTRQAGTGSQREHQFRDTGNPQTLVSCHFCHKEHAHVWSCPQCCLQICRECMAERGRGKL